jgi:hypothetical protein
VVVANDGATQDKLLASDIEPKTSMPEQLKGFVRAEIKK